jgi:hypothetical protein
MYHHAILAYPYNGILFSSKKNEVLIHVSTWMNLESMLKGRRWTKSITLLYCIYVNVHNRQIYRDRK